VFLPDIEPIAEDMTALSAKKFEKKQFEDVAYFEPFYLKEFQPTTPKAKVLVNR
jgi:tRNA threonylcarbamoyladenosine biosynthesis protein TsaB